MLVAFVLGGGWSAGRAQDLEQVGKKDPVTVSGGLSANTGFYSTDLNDPRATPWTWGASARLNFSIYDVQVPFSMTFSEKQRDFRQPFNQYGLSPRYKWFKAHIGYRSMHFSDLTMSGQRFLGGGVELTPGHFRFMAMYGRLRKEIYQDTTVALVEPAFERWAMAAKVGAGTEASHVDLIVFRAEDRFDPTALANGRYGAAQPEENAVVGLDIAQSPVKSLQVHAAASVSLNNVGQVPDERSGSDVSNNYDSFLFNVDSRTRRGTAIKGGISYNVHGMIIGAKYDRIEPLFRTLGNYYFLRDVENIRATFAFGMIRQRLRFQAELGRQHNDLEHIQNARTVRTIKSGNLSYNSGKLYTGTLNYSDFQADMTSLYQAAQTDEVQVTQLAQSVSMNNNFRMRSTDKGNTRSVDMSITWQAFNSDGYGAQDASRTTSWTATCGYRQQLKQRHLSIGFTAMGSRFDGTGKERTKYGGSVNVRKGLDNDRLGISPRLSCYLNSVQEGSQSLSAVVSLGIDRKFGQAHALGLLLNYNTRQELSALDPSLYQVRGQVTYSLTFQPPVKSRPKKQSNP
ncbi:MAG TPA: hypothetical protein PLB89_00865 [Flavobacteriales bacterium]|nr:hypothetical protein [Flavobacteriales bacterium]